jgi:hypothetical protein
LDSEILGFETEKEEAGLKEQLRMLRVKQLKMSRAFLPMRMKETRS